jgi:hypothetical protein
MAAIGALPPPAARLKPSLERSIFGVKRPLSNARRIRGSRDRDVPIRRRRRDAEPVCDLGHANVGIGEHRLGALDVVVGEFRRPASGSARVARRRGRLGCVRGLGCARIPPAHQTCEKPAAPARSSCRGLRTLIRCAGQRIASPLGARSGAPTTGNQHYRGPQPRHLMCAIDARVSFGRSITPVVNPCRPAASTRPGVESSTEPRFGGRCRHPPQTETLSDPPWSGTEISSAPGRAANAARVASTADHQNGSRGSFPAFA